MNTNAAPELHRCVEGLSDMLHHLQAAIHLHDEEGRPLHDFAEAELFCANLDRHLLKDIRERLARPEKQDWIRLSTVLEDGIEQADALSASVDRHRGDFRLAHALGYIADALRFTLPALLRWCHSTGSGHAWQAVDECRARMIRTLGHLDPTGSPTSGVRNGRA